MLSQFEIPWEEPSNNLINLTGSIVFKTHSNREPESIESLVNSKNKKISKNNKKVL